MKGGNRIHGSNEIYDHFIILAEQVFHHPDFCTSTCRIFAKCDTLAILGILYVNWHLKMTFRISLIYPHEKVLSLQHTDQVKSVCSLPAFIHVTESLIPDSFTLNLSIWEWTTRHIIQHVTSSFSDIIFMWATWTTLIFDYTVNTMVHVSGSWVKASKIHVDDESETHLNRMMTDRELFFAK